MKRTLKFLLGGILFIPALAACHRSPWTALEKGFRTPPDSIRAAVYWYWLNDNISKEGVVKDLEAMKRVGITRAFIGNQATTNLPYGDVKLLSDEWWDITHAAMKRAGELGIEIGMFNCPGWSQSGGPWVTPEQSMRYVDSKVLQVHGSGAELSVPLPVMQADHIIAVQAWPSLKGESRNWTLTTKEGNPAVLKMQVPFPVRTLVLESNGVQKTPVTLTRDGKPLLSFDYDRHNLSRNVGFRPLSPWVESLEGAPGSFELRLENPSDGMVTVTLSEIPYMPRFADKSLAKMFQEPLPLWDYYMWERPQEVEPGLCVDPSQIKDLSSFVKDGQLRWSFPAGDWTVLISHLESTGITNSPAVPEGTGLEVDKMSKQHVVAHFDAFVGEILRRIPPEDRKTWKVVVEDSYETGSQNWTDDMAEVFRETYGYDPVPYLPVLQGFVVRSMDESERFLWDLRRLVADRVAYDYVGGLREEAQKHGLETWLECYGHWGFPSEFLLYGSQSNQVAGEFWSEGSLGDIENRAASSCGHIYGKNRIWAESCTAAGRQFTSYPRLMKRRVDRFFCEGINATLLHLYIQQPDDRVPGLDAWFGNEFNRNNAWFEGMGGFVEYLRRCNFLLQQGRYVADVAYFIGEDAPKMTGVCDPPLPKGYSFDYINADVLAHHARVQDGCLVLDSGMSYRVLVLPRQETMRPEMLSVLQGFVREGLPILGPAPVRSPSLQHGIPEADSLVRTLSRQIWDGKDGVYPSGTSLETVFGDLGLKADFSYDGDAHLLFLHRTLGPEGEIYFVSNQEDRAVSFEPSFRVPAGVTAELWDPLTGEKTGWDGRTLALDRFQSLFVVFRKGAVPAATTSAETLAIEGPWTVEFAASAGNPAFTRTFETLQDWARSDDPALRGYSGHATYSVPFTLPSAGPVILDLGEVMALAEVRVNGKRAGGVWTYPYRLDISRLVSKGENTLEVTVYNNWCNRLIADESLPADQRGTWTNIQPYRTGDPAQSSGLLGPVRLSVGGSK